MKRDMKRDMNGQKRDICGGKRDIDRDIKRDISRARPLKGECHACHGRDIKRDMLAEETKKCGHEGAQEMIQFAPPDGDVTVTAPQALRDGAITITGKHSIPANWMNLQAHKLLADHAAGIPVDSHRLILAKRLMGIK